MKGLIFLGSTLDDLRAFPDDARQIAGRQLFRVQRGLDPTDWKPFPTVGPGVREIRIHTETEYRVIYTATFMEKIYVLHAFKKKSRKTSQRHIDVAQKRFRIIKSLQS